MYKALEAWTQDRTKSEILARLGGQVPVGAVRDVAEIMADPHVAARNMAIPLEHPGTTKKYAVAGQPLKFSRTPAIPRDRAPLLDEHGQQVRATVGHPRQPGQADPRANPLTDEESP
jgi:crotonobetainyl-CoA:carnitine CoA-transferase CaiB-like acyl-CoA transferase